MHLSVVVLFFGMILLANGDAPPEEPLGESKEPEGEKISFTSPTLSEEEQHSSHMPEGMNCDACTAIAYQMDEALLKAHKPGKKMKESDYINLFDEVCDGKTWENYGLKSVNGVNRLTGKGLEADEVPGMMYGGGMWPRRLSSKCYTIIGDVGEDELYEVFHEKKTVKKFLCVEYLKDCAEKKKGKKIEL